jgi:hypothetical protein
MRCPRYFDGKVLFFLGLVVTPYLGVYAHYSTMVTKCEGSITIRFGIATHHWCAQPIHYLLYKYLSVKGLILKVVME